MSRPEPSPDEEAFTVEIEGLAPLGRHRRETHETAELKLLDDFGRAADHDVRATGANEIRAEPDGVVARRARSGEGEHHALRADRAGHVNR